MNLCNWKSWARRWRPFSIHFKNPRRHDTARRIPTMRRSVWGTYLLGLCLAQSWLTKVFILSYLFSYFGVNRGLQVMVDKALKQRRVERIFNCPIAFHLSGMSKANTFRKKGAVTYNMSLEYWWRLTADLVLRKWSNLWQKTVHWCARWRHRLWGINTQSNPVLPSWRRFKPGRDAEKWRITYMHKP